MQQPNGHINNEPWGQILSHRSRHTQVPMTIVYTNSLTTIIGSEAMIVYLFVQELTGPVPEGLFRYNRRSLCYERLISATQLSLSSQVPDFCLRMKN